MCSTVAARWARVGNRRSRRIGNLTYGYLAWNAPHYFFQHAKHRLLLETYCTEDPLAEQIRRQVHYMPAPEAVRHVQANSMRPTSIPSVKTMAESVTQQRRLITTTKWSDRDKRNKLSKLKPYRWPECQDPQLLRREPTTSGRKAMRTHINTYQ